MDFEPGVGQGVGVIEHAAFEKHQTLRIDNDAHAFFVEDLIAIGGGIEFHAILHTGAPAFLNENT